MLRTFSAVVLITASLSALAQGAPAASAASGRRVAVPEDTAAIRAVVDEFAAAIAAKDGKRLSALVIDSRILFTSIDEQGAVDRARRYDRHFDGVGVGGFGSFARFITTTKDRIREDFHNVEIRQDGPYAWVVFDYEFVQNEQVANYGVEHWQLRRTDGAWKIFSVVWTQYFPPNATP